MAEIYDENAVYLVKLTRPVTYGRVELKPLPVHQMTGKALNAIVAQHGPDAIDRAEKQE